MTRTVFKSAVPFTPCLVRGTGGVTPAVLMVLVAALLPGTPGCKKDQPAPPPPPAVAVADVTLTNVAFTTEFIGLLDSPQNVEVRARVEAFVEKVSFTEGIEVKEGDRLFALDKRPFEERLAAANGMLAEAMAALNKSQADVARLRPLAEKKAIPQQDLDNAVASVAVGQANMLSAEARAKSAELDLGYCDVRAPLSGLIGARQVSVGSLVGKGEPTLLATISTLDPIWFYCSISEVDYLRAERRLRETGRQMADVALTLILADGSEHPDRGRWVFLDRAVDTKTGTIRARGEFPNSSKVLRPGMFARIRISIPTEQGSILVPERALVELQGRHFVWVVGADHKSRQRSVEVAPIRIAGHAVIQEGLTAGERFVVEGLQKLREGEPVQPMTTAQVAAVAPPSPSQPAVPSGKQPRAGHRSD
jgi:membrane fusion protein, multidrug efflux system